MRAGKALLGAGGWTQWQQGRGHQECPNNLVKSCVAVAAIGTDG